jgi:hypothetical protein
MASPFERAPGRSTDAQDERESHHRGDDTLTQVQTSALSPDRPRERRFGFSWLPSQSRSEGANGTRR